MRTLSDAEVQMAGGGQDDIGNMVACTLAGTVGIAAGFVYGGPVGGILAYFSALQICNSGGGSPFWMNVTYSLS
jgi:hypothetical protein